MAPDRRDSSWTNLLLTAMLVLSPAGAARGQEEDDELRGGLIGTYEAGAASVTRVDRRPAFDWGAAPPDLRLPAGRFKVVWRGLLQSESQGEYQIHVHAQGAVSLKLGDRVLINASLSKPGWLHSPKIDLPFDWHPLEIRLEKTSDRARFSIFWSGPKFQLEPIAARQLLHEPAQTPDQQYAKGKRLADALRCAACHAAPGMREVLPAPSLDRLAGNIRPSWIVEHLKKPSGPKGGELDRRMPAFDLDEDDATAIAAFLLKSSAASQSTKPPKGDAKAGRRLALTVGCLACHRLENLGDSGIYGGGDLSRVAEKRPTDFFARWLASPSKINSAHRMPVFELKAKERADLASLLAGLGDSAAVAAKNPADNDDAVERGRQLVKSLQCASCHQLSGGAKQEAPTRVGLLPGFSWAKGCAGEPKQKRPGYRLSKDQQTALRAYFSAVARLPNSASAENDAASRTVERNNCLACHQRSGSPGLAAKLPGVIEAFPELGTQLPAMTPPSLISVGDKFHDQALAAAIRRQGPVHRPWLLVRMPRFRLSDHKADSLVGHFVERDRIPDGATKRAQPPAAKRVGLAGARLVTPDGFGCTSCHQVGKVKPPKAPLNARGPDLSQLGKRIRHAWFDRWVRNPIRIVPRMEMPSVQIPVGGVLEDDLDRQLATVWSVLNDPNFRPPEPNAVRVVRRLGTRSAGERAAVLTDVLKTPDREYLKPLLVGLPNRHNALFDLESARLAAWWIGDTARQRTKGKTWFWEAAGVPLLQTGSDVEFQLMIDGQTLAPHRGGQFLTEVDTWEHQSGSLLLAHRLRFETPGGRRHVVSVQQSFEPKWTTEKSKQSGFRRRIVLQRLPRAAMVRIQVMSAANVGRWQAAEDRQSLSLQRPGGRLIVRANSPIDESGYVTARSGANGSASVVLDYATDEVVDRFPVLPKTAVVSPPAAAMRVTPGFESTRLPLIKAIMPTGLDWRPSGELIVTSLKGRVWAAKDTNNDGLEDQLVSVSDELAAPFGVRAEKGYLDVVNKYALLRLYDLDGDGRTDRVENLASGWGHTADYHDWAIGLPRDEKGAYYLATACQQDERSLAAARMRGEVLKLTPRTPSPDDPRRFATRTLSAGHRFPIGIARNRSGEMFVTDNQGNYNPFNELNLVTPGKRYGFINRVERKPDFKPPLTPPAINIPHPWTRSVNGICFLETPEAVRRKQGEIFGPFEGHLIGCEYDTRMLIRMSTQKVGDWVQGAAYPFSLYHPQDGQTFLGPLTCAVAPDGDLYVGCIRDSGWGGANNVGTLVRVRPKFSELPAGIAEVRAIPRGFNISFTKPVNAGLAAELKNYTISSYTRVSTPAYGGPDARRRTEKITQLRVAADRRGVNLELAALRAGFVYEIRVRNLAGQGNVFHPAEAFYSMTVTPTE